MRHTRIAQPVNDDDIAKEEEVGDKGDVDIDTGEESEQSEGDNFKNGNANGSDADGSVTINEARTTVKHVLLSRLVGYIPSSSVRLRKCQICQTGK